MRTGVCGVCNETVPLNEVHRCEDKPMKVAIYAQHTVMAGRRCWDEEMIEKGSDDLHIFAGSEAELQDEARRLALTETGHDGPNSAYWRRVAATLADATGLQLDL